MSKVAFKDIPRRGLIKENETITLFSIFDFKGGAGELFPFLYMCRELNCTVVFENEGIKVVPDDRDIMQNTQLVIYATIAMEKPLSN